MRTQRMPPWDLDGDLWDKLNQIKIREQRPWRWMLTKGVELFIEWYESKNGVVRLPGVDVLPVAVSPALVLPAVSGGVSPVVESQAVALPAAAPVVLSAAASKVAWLRGRVEAHKVALEEARARLLVEPEHIPSKTVLRARTLQLAEDEGWLVEAEAVLAAELSTKQIDNGENAACEGEGNNAN